MPRKIRRSTNRRANSKRANGACVSPATVPLSKSPPTPLLSRVAVACRVPARRVPAMSRSGNTLIGVSLGGITVNAVVSSRGLASCAPRIKWPGRRPGIGHTRMGRPRPAHRARTPSAKLGRRGRGSAEIGTALALSSVLRAATVWLVSQQVWLAQQSAWGQPYLRPLRPLRASQRLFAVSSDGSRSARHSCPCS